MKRINSEQTLSDFIHRTMTTTNALVKVTRSESGGNRHDLQGDRTQLSPSKYNKFWLHFYCISDTNKDDEWEIKSDEAGIKGDVKWRIGQRFSTSIIRLREGK